MGDAGKGAEPDGGQGCAPPHFHRLPPSWAAPDPRDHAGGHMGWIQPPRAPPGAGMARPGVRGVSVATVSWLWAAPWDNAPGFGGSETIRIACTIHLPLLSPFPPPKPAQRGGEGPPPGAALVPQRPVPPVPLHPSAFSPHAAFAQLTSAYFLLEGALPPSGQRCSPLPSLSPSQNRLSPRPQTPNTFWKSLKKTSAAPQSAL